jgi:L-iditol 2-dehydrogenase
MKTKQLIFTGIGKYETKTVELPELKENQLLIKVEACGLCTWERHIFHGLEHATFPFHGGHEIAGTIVAKGSGVSSELTIGMHAAVAKWPRCNCCYECRKGLDNHCRQASGEIQEGTLWGPGGFSEYLTAESYEIFPLKSGCNVFHAALGEPLACVTRSIKRSRITEGSTAVVIGAGLMGLLFLKLLKLRGVKVIIVQTSAFRRDLAAKMGADMVINPKAENWIDKVKQATDGCGAAAVFYTAGGGETLRESLNALEIGGTLMIYAPSHSDMPVLPPDEIHYRELVVTGSIRHDKESFMEAVKLVSEGLVNLDDLILEFGSCEDFENVLKKAEENREIHRILLRW